VNSTGQVTGVAVGGPITVTATTSNGKQGSSQVTVTPSSSTVTYASISGGFAHTCAMTPAGVAYCWGAGGQGQLGDASNQAFYYKPIMVVGGQTWAVVRAGGNYTCALTTGGTPYCWGTGPNLGDNSTTGHSSPVQVAGGLTVDSVTAGNGQACVLQSGAAHCWGSNEYGQIGTNSTSFSYDSTPQAVDQNTLAFTAMSARGDSHVCALIASGSAFCWGLNTSGQLGAGNTAGEDSIPAGVIGTLTFSSIATGGNHTCGIVLSSGTTECWGDDLAGELGDNNPGTITGTLVIVQGSHTFVQVVAGEGFTCGLTAPGVAWCWGMNSAGQLGNNTTTEANTPVQVSGGLAFTTISAGGDFVCGLVAGGAAYCWGDNSSGQLGINSSTIQYSAVPVAVASP
jgi:alpha-tubulin suppressor-like RCC1 family protein